VEVKAERRHHFVEPVLVAVDAGVDEATIVLTPFVEARIRVTREDGTPVEGACVRASSAVGVWTAFVTRGAQQFTTDADGRIRLPPLEPGVRIDLMITARGSGLLPLVLPAWAPQDQTLVLASAHLLRGRILDADGRPVADATVWMRAPRFAPALPQRGYGWWRDPDGFILGAVADAEGAFSIPDLAPGVVVLRAKLRCEDGTVRTSGSTHFDTFEGDARLTLGSGH